MSDPVKHLEANGCKHALIEAGEPNATAVLLLHGFPNNKNLWQKQVPVLVKAGFRVIVPDLRGAVGGESYSPAEVEAYHIDKHIVKDLAGILDALKIQQVHVIGHDWGSAVAWTFAGFYPERTLQLVGISVGHPSGYLKGDHRGEQKQKSWYILLIDIPGVGEQAIASGAIFDGLTSPEAAKVEGPMWQELGLAEGMQKPGALTAALNWYRANAPPEAFVKGALFPCPEVTCDVLQIWPTGDSFVCSEGQAKSSGQFVKSPGTFRYERLETPSHFAPWTDPEPVSKLILSFLKKQ